MSSKYKSRPQHRGYQTALMVMCENCEGVFFESRGSYSKKKRHFCSMKCYSAFRKTKLPMEQQPAYKGVRGIGKSKQVYHRNYCKRNPENIAHLKSLRYARERNAKGTHTLKEWQLLKLKFKNKCAMCSEQKPLTKDHITPLSKGGTNNIDNIQPLCRNCNSKKHNKIIYSNPELLQDSK